MDADSTHPRRRVTQAPSRRSADRSGGQTCQRTVGIRPSGEPEYCWSGDDDRGLELEIIGVIVATDKRLALTTIADDGSKPLIDRFVAGFEGSGITVNPLGIEILGSAKGIPTAGWYLAVATPTEVA